MMRPVEEHARLVADLIAPTEPDLVPLEHAVGRALATDVRAPLPLPLFDNSAMDGYAVRVADIVSVPVSLPVTTDIPAGRVDVPRLEPGTAHRIMTGALMPEGADAVIPVESTDGDAHLVRIDEVPAVGAHLRRAGVDVEAGQVVLPTGVTVGASQVGLAAALGMVELEVRRPLRIAVLSTGTELVAPGNGVQPGQVYESNSIMLATALREAGSLVDTVHFVHDDVAHFRAAFAELVDHDLVVTSGGVSAGTHEVVKQALTGCGVEFAKVAMQPGMPQGAGTYEGVPVVTLPGNPVSSLVSFEVFLRPAIRAAMGHRNTQRRQVTAELAESLDAPARKRQFRRGYLDPRQGTVSLAGPPGSHFLSWLAGADCLIDVPEEATHLKRGELVTVWLLGP